MESGQHNFDRFFYATKTLCYFSSGRQAWYMDYVLDVSPPASSDSVNNNVLDVSPPVSSDSVNTKQHRHSTAPSLGSPANPCTWCASLNRAACPAGTHLARMHRVMW